MNDDSEKRRFGFAKSSRYKSLGVVAAFVLSAWATTAKAFCWDYAARYSHMPVDLLKAIATVESGCDPNAFNKNKDGSHDIGLMQINSVHLARLKKYDGIEERQLYEPCTNLLVGSRILWEQVMRYGWTWQAVGAYHMPDPNQLPTQVDYAKLVWSRVNFVRTHPNQCVPNDRRNRR